MRIPRVRRSTLGVLALAAPLALAGCGGSSSGGGQTVNASNTPSKSSGAAALVPAAIKSKGTITVATDASYAPNEFKKPDGSIVGWDVDFAKALGQQMGLKVDVVNVTFANIIPGLKAKRYDLGISSFTDTKEREATVDFVTYYNAGTAFFVPTQGGPNIQSLADLCGHKVAVESGTTQETDAKAQSKKCTQAGKPKVTVQSYPTQTAANLALSSGRAEVSMADSPVADYQVKQSGGKFKLSGQIYGAAPYGIAIPKGTGLAPAVQAGVKALISDGTYMNILNKWGVESGAITTPQINGATS